MCRHPMTVESSWRIVADGSVSPPYNHHETIREGLALAKEHGVLTPDTRLQGIADEWNKVEEKRSHRNHIHLLWPDLFSLLDALTKENET